MYMNVFTFEGVWVLLLDSTRIQRHGNLAAARGTLARG